MLSEALSIVKMQTQQMKRYLVSEALRRFLSVRQFLWLRSSGNGTAYGCAEERKYNARGTENLVAVAETVLRTL